MSSSLPRPPRPPDPRGGAQDIARFQRELQDYLARAVSVLEAAASTLPDKQDADPTLTALAALDGGVGLLEQTGPDTFTKRPIGVGSAFSVLTRAAGDGRYDALGAAAAVSAVKATGPGSADDNAVARYDGATGKLLQNSPVTVDDNGVLAGFRFGTHGVIGAMTVTGYIAIVDAAGVSRNLAVVS